MRHSAADCHIYKQRNSLFPNVISASPKLEAVHRSAFKGYLSLLAVLMRLKHSKSYLNIKQLDVCTFISNDMKCTGSLRPFLWAEMSNSAMIQNVI